MLADLVKIRENSLREFNLKPNSFYEDFKIPTNLKSQLLQDEVFKETSGLININDFTTIFTTKDNVTIFPNQFYKILSCIYKELLSIKEYMDNYLHFYELLKNEFPEREHVKKFQSWQLAFETDKKNLKLILKEIDIPETIKNKMNLNKIDFEFFLKFLFTDFRGSKAICDSKGFRGDKDLFSSIVLAFINVPAVTSSAIGELAYCLYKSNKLELLENIYSEDKFTDKRVNIFRGINRIFYGAPGTGKSHIVNQMGNIVARTVFHNEYTNTDFVGQLKPCNIDGKISYEFVPGPLLQAIVKARKISSEQTLVIEELNRANAAAVFGEFFQLLDRDSISGESIYSVNLSVDASKWITKELSLPIAEEYQIKIPGNLNILATMNSADQGVMHLDSAFKRRWEFEYIPINTEDEFCKKTIFLCGSEKMNWGMLIRNINEKLGSINIPEDRWIGHRFLSEIELDPLKFTDHFSNKVLMYLYDDVLKHNKKSILFKDEFSKSLNQLKIAFKKGENIFVEGIIT